MSYERSVEHLARLCPPYTLPFATTNELPDLQDVIGQPHAIRALDLGSEVDGIGYNIFVLGTPDSGRTTLTRDYLQLKAALSPLPEDWCYVNNLDNLRQPYALHMPAGLAIKLRKDMRLLVAECKQNIPRVFASEEYTHERDRLVNEMKEKLEHELSQTGYEFGERQSDGTYPNGTFNQAVIARLEAFERVMENAPRAKRRRKNHSGNLSNTEL